MLGLICSNTYATKTQSPHPNSLSVLNTTTSDLSTGLYPIPIQCWLLLIKLNDQLEVWLKKCKSDPLMIQHFEAVSALSIGSVIRSQLDVRVCLFMLILLFNTCMPSFIHVWYSAGIWMISMSWSYRHSQESKAGSFLKQKEGVRRPGSRTRA